MHLTEPTRGTREFLRLRDKRADELRQFTKPLRGAKKVTKRQAAIQAALSMPLTDKQKGQGR